MLHKTRESWAKIFGGALLLTAAASAPAQSEFIKAIAGDDSDARLLWSAPADGGDGAMNTTTTDDGALERIEIKGRVDLQSDKLNLKSNYLLYDAAKEEMLARGEVRIDQPEVSATSEEMRYDIKSGSIVLTGKPEVTQSAPDRSARFAGMERFELKRNEKTGASEIRLTGGSEIMTEMTSVKPAEGAATPTATASTEGTGGGFAGLGNVRITTRAYNGQEPTVIMNTGSTGGMGQYSARGSVLLQSDQLNLRADQLDFNQEEGLVTALYNVVLKQEDIEAEAGRMQYEVASQKTTLSVDPVIRKQISPTEQEEISNLSSFIITRKPGGGNDTSLVPAAGQWARYERIQLEQPKDTGPRATPQPEEIRLDNPADLDKIGGTK